MTTETTPLTPSPQLLCKLGSIIVHAEEMMGKHGHAFDRVSLETLVVDPEVQEWIKAMNAMAMLPVKRNK